MKSKPVILIVDDQPQNIELLEAYLVPQGYEIVKAENGEAALMKIEEKTVDLVLLDILMPKVDGFEVCRRIKENDRFRNIPVVMITALSAKEDRIKGIEAGAEDFITKPIDKGEVLARVKMLLKMKTLNDRLTHAYEEISNMTNFGEASILSFDPLDFDFLAKVDTIVHQLIRKSVDAIDKPQLIIVGVPDERHAWQWYQYEYILRELDRTHVDIDIQQGLDKTGKSKIVIFNENDLDQTELRSFAKKLASLSIKVFNMACYLSESLRIFAVNYGRDVTPYDASVLNSFVMQTLFLKSLSSQMQDARDEFEYSVQSLARVSEIYGEDTGKHVIRVGRYCALLAKKLNKPAGFVNSIRIQAVLHDAGNIHIPSVILKKPDELSSGEWIVIKQHPLFGAKIIGDHSRFKMAKAIALTHHERWDGTGYPNGLYQNNIPLEGRIAAIADIYDALRNARIYKKAFKHKTACEILTRGDGRTMPKHFDPLVLKAFIDLSDKFEEVYEMYKG